MPLLIARLSPVTLTQKLTGNEIRRLHEATIATLIAWTERLRAEAAGGDAEQRRKDGDRHLLHPLYGLEGDVRPSGPGPHRLRGDGAQHASPAHGLEAEERGVAGAEIVPGPFSLRGQLRPVFDWL